MDSSLNELLSRFDSVPDRFGELRDGVRKAIAVSEFDPEMSLTRARKVLEFVIRDVYRSRLKEPPGTRPLENLIQRLVKDELFPIRLDAYAATVRKLGNVGTHSHGDTITVADVHRSLTQLMPILEWYFEQHGQVDNDLSGDGSVTDAAANNKPVATTVSMSAIVPKGLRSFDTQDSDFFIQLLPGPRDRHGLPESLRSWKNRIEADDAVTFTVGMIYGPSGCGKSSLVKAGLLPRLSKNILSVYIEATPGETEQRLLSGVRQACPDLSADLDLVETLRELRSGRGIPAGHSVLLVIDQFEQWLHAKRGEDDTDLVRALRQCDSDHVQCIVMVRDDFWMAATRFMRELDIPQVQGQNVAVVDLFDHAHARNVLAAFGRAYGRLPTASEPLTPDQDQFLEQAVNGLSQDGKVICVRLALFAEMMKGKPWAPATLKQIGGIEGVGVTFLEETFSSSVAPAEYRTHEQAARSLLKSLLPEQGTDIKGHMRSRAELLDVSGYRDRPRDFEDLMRVLDQELRLVTPTESNESDVSDSPRSPKQNSYQLTHDYLVHALREWLTRKQKETRRGRAELLLAERAELWTVKPHNRHLPTWWEHLSIRWFSRRRDWTRTQRRMMSRAILVHFSRAAAAVLILATICWGLYDLSGRSKAATMVRALATAATADVPAIVTDLSGYGHWAVPLLNTMRRDNPPGSKESLHASLALLEHDGSQVAYLQQQLLSAPYDSLETITSALKPYRKTILPGLSEILDNSDADETQRFHAACALVLLDSDETTRWTKHADYLAGRLVTTGVTQPSRYGLVTTMFRPIRGFLVGPLRSIVQDAGRDAVDRMIATNIFADYAADSPRDLVQAVMGATEQQFPVFYEKLRNHAAQALPLLQAAINEPPAKNSTNEERSLLASRQANAAICLYRLGIEDALQSRPKQNSGSTRKRDVAACVFRVESYKAFRRVLVHTPDPTRRSYVISRLGRLGGEAAPLMAAVKSEPDTSVRRAILLALGSFPDLATKTAARSAFVTWLKTQYRDDPDPGMHTAIEWLLRHWQVGDDLFDAVIAERSKSALPAVHSADQTDTPPREWFVNPHGQTMVLIRGPVEFVMGSPKTEPGRQTDKLLPMETQHRVRIPRSFAVSDRQITVEEFHKFLAAKPPGIHHSYWKSYSPELHGAQGAVTWYEAAAYCRWLSEQEKIPEDQMCFPPIDRIKSGMKLPEDYLSRTGYRLPSEAEWEYACRADSVTSYFHGNPEELLGEYCWYLRNNPFPRVHLPWSKKPNDFGLLDLYGNGWEWCMDTSRQYTLPKKGRAIIDREDNTIVASDPSRVLRGGGLTTHPNEIRSAERFDHQPEIRLDYVGFRIVRTMPVQR